MAAPEGAEHLCALVAGDAALVHFRDAVEKGLKHGSQIGEWAVDHALELQRRPRRQ